VGAEGGGGWDKTTQPQISQGRNLRSWESSCQPENLKRILKFLNYCNKEGEFLTAIFTIFRPKVKMTAQNFDYLELIVREFFKKCYCC